MQVVALLSYSLHYILEPLLAQHFQFAGFLQALNGGIDRGQKLLFVFADHHPVVFFGKPHSQGHEIRIALVDAVGEDVFVTDHGVDFGPVQSPERIVQRGKFRDRYFHGPGSGFHELMARRRRLHSDLLSREAVQVLDRLVVLAPGDRISRFKIRL